MLIVLEGVDKAGKSTLASKLQEKSGWPIVHFGRPGPDPALEYISFLKQNQDVICDRFFIGELVYGPLLRGKQSMSPLQITTIQRVCRTIGIVVVHVNPPYEIIEARMRRLGDKMVTNSQNRKAYTMFQAVMSQIKMPCFQWNGSGDIDEIVNDIGKLTSWRPEHKIARDVCTGIGTVVDKKIVFVGDTLSKNNTWFNLPFDGGPAAKYFLKSLVLSGVDEKLVYVVNADTIKIKEVVFLKHTGETQFVALGNNAYKKLKELGVTCSRVDHPQYWNRFHNSGYQDYSMLLSQAVKEAPIYHVDLQRI